VIEPTICVSVGASVSWVMIEISCISKRHDFDVPSWKTSLFVAICDGYLKVHSARRKNDGVCDSRAYNYTW